jgi:hypothetical protein
MVEKYSSLKKVQTWPVARRDHCPKETRGSLTGLSGAFG